MAAALTLTPFFEPENADFPGGELFVAGYKDENGDRCGIIVPVEREIIENLVLTSTPFEPHLDSDGSVQAWPGGWVSDEMFGEMLKGELLPKMPIDELVAQTLSLDRNEPSTGEDGVLESYVVMRERLNRAVALVDEEIARRKAQL